MKPRQLMEMGYEQGPAIGMAVAAWTVAYKQIGEDQARQILRDIAVQPERHFDDQYFGELAKALHEFRQRSSAFVERETPAPYAIWGEEQIEAGAVGQLKASARLPVAVRGALMPDAHVGYGLPIGGVLATKNAVIPYAVGVDIACRMRLTVFPIDAAQLDRMRDRLVKILQRETVFGAGATQRSRTEHEVLEEDWSFAPVVQRVAEKARGQIGTSGSGNHFVEFGELTVLPGQDKALGLAPGSYLALLSHSGSRGPGATIADFYSKLAMNSHPELPDDLRRLAWLDLDTDNGREYWAAMELMGRFASANHAVIHRKIVKAIGESPALTVENHHNFAWKEQHDGQEVIVHRKGATPAGEGVLGVIPGSMAAPGYVVRGKGKPESLDSASHGAGRKMSRTAAKAQFRWGNLKPMLQERKVTVLAAGIDEAPPAYKDIDAVMAAQSDLVQPLARFDPRIVRMADAGEAQED